MPVVELSPSFRQRGQGLPTLRCVNVLWNGGVGAFFDRPGLVAPIKAGTGPIRGMFAQSGLFGGDRFIYSGAQLYREDAILATAPGAGAVRFAGGGNGDADCLVWCADGRVWRFDSGVVTAVEIPDGREIFDVLFFGGRFLFFAGDGRFYYSGINDPTAIDALSFETAEARPDGFLRAVVSGNQMFVFGPESVEAFYLSSDPQAPYAPDLAGRLDFGAFSADLIHEHQGRVWFVSSKKQVFQLGGGLQAIGDDSMLEALGRSQLGDTSLCTVFVDGLEVLILTDRAEASFVFDGSRWYRWKRMETASLNISGSLNVGSVSYVGDMSSGRVFRLDNRVHADQVVIGEDRAIERVVSCYRPLAGGRVRNISAMLHCARGAGTLELPDPQVEMRYSDDLNTWSEWDGQPLGGHGRYDERPVWRALGHMQPPGRIYEFRCTDNVDFAPQAVVVDEARL